MGRVTQKQSWATQHTRLRLVKKKSYVSGGATVLQTRYTRPKGVESLQGKLTPPTDALSGVESKG